MAGHVLLAFWYIIVFLTECSFDVNLTSRNTEALKQTSFTPEIPLLYRFIAFSNSCRHHRRRHRPLSPWYYHDAFGDH